MSLSDNDAPTLNRSAGALLGKMRGYLLKSRESHDDKIGWACAQSAQAASRRNPRARNLGLWSQSSHKSSLN